MPETPLTHWLIVAPHYWRKSEKLDDAINGIVKDCGQYNSSLTVHVRKVDSEAYVDEMGQLYAHKKKDYPDLTIPASYNRAASDLQEMLENIKDHWGCEYDEED